MSWDEDGGDACSLGEGRVKRATEKALLVELEDGSEVWIPRSVVHDDSEVYDDGEASEGEVVVKRWFAEKESLA